MQIPTAENFKVLPQGVDAKFDTHAQPVDVLTSGVKNLQRGLGIWGQRRENQEIDRRLTDYKKFVWNKLDQYQQMQNESALKDEDGNDVLAQMNREIAEARSKATRGLFGDALNRFDAGVADTEHHWERGSLNHRNKQEESVDMTLKNAMVDDNFREGVEAIMSGDYDAFDRALGRSEQASRDFILKHKGWYSQDLVDRFAKQESAMQVLGSVQVLREKDPEVARVVLEKYKERLDPEQYTKVMADVVRAEQAKAGAEDAQRILESGEMSVGGDLAGGARDAGSFAKIIAKFAVPHESGSKGWSAKNNRGTARGKYQVVSSIWIPELKRRYGKTYTESDFHDPVKGEEIFQLVSKAHYDDAVKMTGRTKFTPGECYQIHFLGSGGFAQMSRAPADALVSSIPAVKANNYKFMRDNMDSKGNGYLTKGGKPRTVGEFRQLMERKMAPKVAGVRKKVNWKANDMTADRMFQQFKEAHPGMPDSYYQAAKEVILPQASLNRDNKEREQEARAAMTDQRNYNLAVYNAKTSRLSIENAIRKNDALNGFSKQQMEEYYKTMDMPGEQNWYYCGYFLGDESIMQNSTLDGINAITAGDRKLRSLMTNTWYRYHNPKKYNPGIGSLSREDVAETYRNLGIDPQNMSNDDKTRLGRVYHFAYDYMSKKRGKKEITMADALKEGVKNEFKILPF